MNERCLFFGKNRGATLIEFLTVFSIVCGAVVGAVYGYRTYGFWGGIGGVPVGAILCFFSVIVVGGALVYLGVKYELLQQRLCLKGRFGKYWAPDREEEWRALPKRIDPLEEVRGEIICQFYYGVFVDTGHGFPGLLKVSRSEGGVSSPQAPKGSIVKVRLLSCGDDRCIELTQGSKESQLNECPTNRYTEPQTAE